MMKFPKRIEMTPFPKGKRIAVTTSFDDGDVADRRLVAAFNDWGLKGTFNLNSGTLGKSGIRPPDGARQRIDQSEVAELYKGHEVAIHTVTHPDLRRLDVSQIALEVLEDRKALENLVGYPVRGMAYPFGHSDPRVLDILRSVGIVYCRACHVVSPCFPPPDPLLWGTSGHQYASIAENFEKVYNNPRFTGVYFPWGHSYEFDDNKDWAGFEKIFKPLSGKPDVWYCTNIELFDYEDARKRMVIAANRAIAYNPSAISVTLNVDGELIDVAGGQTISLAK